MEKFQIPFETALGLFGSAARLARRMGVTESAVSQWRRKGFLPEGRSYQIACRCPEHFPQTATDPTEGERE